MTNTASSTGTQAVIYDYDPHAPTEKEVEEVRALLRLVRKEKRTLMIQPRFDGNGGLYMALTMTPGELRKLK